MKVNGNRWSSARGSRRQTSGMMTPGALCRRVGGYERPWNGPGRADIASGSSRRIGKSSDLLDFGAYVGECVDCTVRLG